ncbi:hypothetical protein R2F61_01350 [Mollicutes bacterium LVI A0078]|nr:hypothetical protein RZE84_01345 [Mollicutes bacterium LVI A0075]WOO91224.1 hypothetical protein R2F61_01350 [Mollicutes bacterium LVI A0078]
MEFNEIGFNFIDQCNNLHFVQNLSKYTKFTKSSKEQIDIKLLTFVEFDSKYDAIYYNAKINNSVISYYGNAILTPAQVKNIDRTIFDIKVVEDYISFLRFSNKSSSEETFDHFWKLSVTNYQIKVEPADLFKRKRG